MVGGIIGVCSSIIGGIDKMGGNNWHTLRQFYRFHRVVIFHRLGRIVISTGLTGVVIFSRFGGKIILYGFGRVAVVKRLPPILGNDNGGYEWDELRNVVMVGLRFIMVLVIFIIQLMGVVFFRRWRRVC